MYCIWCSQYPNTPSLPAPQLHQRTDPSLSQVWCPFWCRGFSLLCIRSLQPAHKSSTLIWLALLSCTALSQPWAWWQPSSHPLPGVVWAGRRRGSEYGPSLEVVGPDEGSHNFVCHFFKTFSLSSVGSLMWMLLRMCRKRLQDMTFAG